MIFCHIFSASTSASPSSITGAIAGAIVSAGSIDGLAGADTLSTGFAIR